MAHIQIVPQNAAHVALLIARIGEERQTEMNIYKVFWISQTYAPRNIEKLEGVDRYFKGTLTLA